MDSKIKTTENEELPKRTQKIVKKISIDEIVSKVHIKQLEQDRLEKVFERLCKYY